MPGGMQPAMGAYGATPGVAMGWADEGGSWIPDFRKLTDSVVLQQGGTLGPGDASPGIASPGIASPVSDPWLYHVGACSQAWAAGCPHPSARNATPSQSSPMAAAPRTRGRVLLQLPHVLVGLRSEVPSARDGQGLQ